MKVGSELIYSLENVFERNIHSAVPVQKVGEEPSASLEEDARSVHKASEGAVLWFIIQGTTHEHFSMAPYQEGAESHSPQQHGEQAHEDHRTRKHTQVYNLTHSFIIIEDLTI